MYARASSPLDHHSNRDIQQDQPRTHLGRVLARSRHGSLPSYDQVVSLIGDVIRIE